MALWRSPNAQRRLEGVVGADQPRRRRVRARLLGGGRMDVLLRPYNNSKCTSMAGGALGVGIRVGGLGGERIVDRGGLVTLGGRRARRDGGSIGSKRDSFGSLLLLC